MLVDPDNPPAFYKLLLSREAFMNKILMPSDFVKKHKKMLTKACLLKTDVAGMSWEAKIVREKPNYFICEGDWPRFVVHHQLKHGDVLLFFLVEKSTFRVQPYTPKCCRSIRERQLLYEELSSSCSEEEIGPSRRSKRAKSVDPLIVLDSEEETVDTSSSDDESKHEDDPSYAHPAIYSKKPKREKASSGGSDEEEEAESGSEEEIGPKKIKFSVINLNNKDPYYEIVVKKSHSTFMTIPMRFAKWAGIIGMKKLRLVNEEGNEWGVEIVHIGARFHIRKGWAEFRTHNKIASGETCRFKLIQGRGANVLQVQKVPKPHSL
ncbi:B3 domain-containing protein LOC_Os12g40080-like isoform X1 [Lycium barbarum]|uniref:B3 domain-containing protein LOC_Os12g40080-like isoform X1 n=1 Tax=Lycium barbarum TaxID=112863 RepID=UPI00293F5D77|nr:B3 domain-containing protein LOC_Os12g40080-like isoform X1 [Lycium barbarum]